MSDAIADEIEKLIEEEFMAGNANDVEALLRLRTPDAVELFPGAPPIVGQDAIRAAWKQETDVIEQYTNRSIQEVNLAGDWAFIRFVFTHTITPVAGGDPHISNSQGLWIIRRQLDGSWKIHWEMVNSSDEEL
jgi:uncharacterized protein (TIGR02246 family)